MKVLSLPRGLTARRGEFSDEKLARIFVTCFSDGTFLYDWLLLSVLVFLFMNQSVDPESIAACRPALSCLFLPITFRKSS